MGNVTTPATTPADPIGWYEAEPNCAGADLRNLLQWPGQMLHSGQMHWQAEHPNTTNPVWPLYSHPARAEPEPQWVADLRQELMMAKMTHNFTLSRDEVMYLLATPSPGKAPEPIYQYQKADGSWIDQTEQSYRYNQQHAADKTRIVYASPGKAEAEDAARYRFLMSTAYGNLLPSTEALDASTRPISASIQQERDKQ